MGDDEVDFAEEEEVQQTTNNINIRSPNTTVGTTADAGNKVDDHEEGGGVKKSGKEKSLPPVVGIKDTINIKDILTDPTDPKTAVRTLLVKNIDPDDLDKDIWKGKLALYAECKDEEIEIFNWPSTTDEGLNQNVKVIFPSGQAANKCKIALENRGTSLEINFQDVKEVQLKRRNFLDDSLESYIGKRRREEPNYNNPDAAGAGGFSNNFDPNNVRSSPQNNNNKWNNTSSDAGGSSGNNSKNWNNGKNDNNGYDNNGYDYQGWSWVKGKGKRGYGGPMYTDRGGNDYGPYSNGPYSSSKGKDWDKGGYGKNWDNKGGWDNKGCNDSGKGWDNKGCKVGKPEYIDPNLPSWLANKGYGSEVDITKGKTRKGKGKEGKGKNGKQNMYALPDEPVSKWSPDMPLEKQLIDYLNMKRNGLLNRHIVISGLPDRMMTLKNIRKEFDSPLEDGTSSVLSIELHTMMGRDAAHLALKDTKAAIALKTYVEELSKTSYNGQLKIAHAPPRKAGHTLWIGGLPWSETDKPWFLAPLKFILEKYGPLALQKQKEQKPAWFDLFRESQKKDEERNGPTIVEVTDEKKEGETKDESEKKEGETKDESEKKEGETKDESEKKEGETKDESEKKEGETKDESEKKSDDAEKKPEDGEKKDADKKDEKDGEKKEGDTKDEGVRKEGESADTEKKEVAEKEKDECDKKEGDHKPAEGETNKPPTAEDKEFEEMKKWLTYVHKKHCLFVTYQNVADAISARNHLYALPMPDGDRPTYLNIDFLESDEEEEDDALNTMLQPGVVLDPAHPLAGLQPGHHAAASSIPPGHPGAMQPGGQIQPGAYPPIQNVSNPIELIPKGGKIVEKDDKQKAKKNKKEEKKKKKDEEKASKKDENKENKRDSIRDDKEDRKYDKHESKHESSKKHEKYDKTDRGDKYGDKYDKYDKLDRHDSSKHDTNNSKDKKKEKKEEKEPEDVTLQIRKMGEAVCSIKASYISGNKKLEFEKDDLEIAQRTKIEHLLAHAARLDSNKKLAVYHVHPVPAYSAEAKSAYANLVEYFSSRERVALVQSPKLHIYLIPSSRERNLGFLEQCTFLPDKSKQVEDGFVLVMIPAVKKD